MCLQLYVSSIESPQVDYGALKAIAKNVIKTKHKRGRFINRYILAILYYSRYVVITNI